MLDRIDMCVEARRIDYDELTKEPPEESSETIRRRVASAIAIQKERYMGTNFHFNSDLTAEGVKKYCRLTPGEEKMMKEVYDSMGLTARSYFRILKVARTAADLGGSEQIQPEHLMEAVGFRSVDRRYWEKAMEI